MTKEKREVFARERGLKQEKEGSQIGAGQGGKTEEGGRKDFLSFASEEKWRNLSSVSL